MQTPLFVYTPISAATKSAKPFMKWAGGKSQLIEKLNNLFPSEMRNGKIKKYVEPFIGGGALFFYVAQTYPSIETFFISDVNQELILAYKTIQTSVGKLIVVLQDLEKEYHALVEQSKNIFSTKKELSSTANLQVLISKTFMKIGLSKQL